MRYFIAAAFILSAAPAAAQRVDTHRIDTTGSETSCTLRAAPDLSLSHNGARAIYGHWVRQAIGPDPNDGVRLYFGFSPEPGTSRTTPFGVIATTSFYLDTPLLEHTRRVRVEVDGRDIGVAPLYDPPYVPKPGEEEDDQILVSSPRPRPPRLWTPSTWSFPAKDRATAVQRIMRGKRLTLILLDESGREVGRFRWDTHSLRDIPEILDRIDWSCTGPIRN